MHKSLSPWLRYNPINWTIMLVLGLAGLLLSLRHPTSRIIAWMIVVYAAGVLLFFVSARFRLPLIPLLAIMAGGCLMLKAKDRRQKAEGGESSQESEARSQNIGPSHGTLDHVKQFTLKQWLASITGLLGIGTLSLTSFAQVDDSSTAVQDYMLMSRANLELQHYDTALRSAEQALQLNPQHPAALEIACLAQYAILVEQLPELPPTAILQQNLQQCLHVSAFSPQARFNAGIYAHLLGQKQQAQQLWYSLIDQQSNQLQPALAALQFTHALRLEDKATIATLSLTEMNTMLLMSEIYAGNEQAKEHLNGLWSPAEKQYHLQIINGLFFRDKML